MSLTAVCAVNIAVTEVVEPEKRGSAAARIAVERADSPACMMSCDGLVAPVDISDKRIIGAKQESNSTCSDRDKTYLELEPPVE